MYEDFYELNRQPFSHDSHFFPSQVYKKRTEVAKKEYLKALAAYRASLVSQVSIQAAYKMVKMSKPPENLSKTFLSHSLIFSRHQRDLSKLKRTTMIIFRESLVREISQKLNVMATNATKFDDEGAQKTLFQIAANAKKREKSARLTWI